jgi:anti-sigma factor RsiW
MTPDLDEMIVAYLVGDLPAEGAAALEDRLSRDSAARDRFARICFEDLALREVAVMGVSTRRRSRRPIGTRWPRSAPSSWLPALAAVGIFVGLVALLGTPPGRPPEEPVAAAPSAPPPPQEPEAPPSAPPAAPPVEERPVPKPPSPAPVPPPPAPPRIDPLPSPPAPKPTPTVVAAAHLERATGATLDDRTVRAGAPVPPGASIRTEGAGSEALVVFPDGTRLELGPDTQVRDFFDLPGKSLRLERGFLRADVAPQPPGRPMVFFSPQAEATVLGTRLTLRADADVTRLEVQEGRVRLLRLSDRASAEVRAGYQAAAGPSVRPRATPVARFVKGINLNGPAVTIEGNRWLSHAQALTEGLSFGSDPQLTVTTVPPRPEPGGETTLMLNSAVFRQGQDLTLRQTLPNGSYEVTLWVMENLQSFYRSFDVRVEGVLCARNVGEKMKLGEWVKLGPFRAEVSDGMLEVQLVKTRADPHLMGIAIFRVGAP